MRPIFPFLCGWLITSVAIGSDEPAAVDFRRDVAPILVQHCLRCHQGDEAKGDIDLTRAASVIAGRGDGWLVEPGRPEESYLLDVLSGDKPAMPKAGDPLSPGQVAILRKWIADGAAWPQDVVLRHDPLAWWSLQPLQRPAPPALSPEDRKWVRTPVDAFIIARQRELGLGPSPEADRRTLVRRLFFDVTGLPPTPGDVERFVHDPDPRAYEKLVDRLLASPHYGERWARHWLDVVHYGDTHGYDKDKPRPNAWPYRDYVIRAFNEDRPYHRFVEEQLAGDWLYPGTRDGIVALGFIAAGPFDFVGQIEVRNGTMEKQRVRNIDRDDMVSATMNTFVSLTAQCARCHDHKFDPITQEDYYCLQAVFAAVDRADRPYDPDPQTAARRLALQKQQNELTADRAAVQQQMTEKAGSELTAIDQKLAELSQQTDAPPRPEYGYHSAIEARADMAKWVQIDLGRSVPVGRMDYVAAYDDFAGIGAGFGFPVRYKLAISDDPDFQEDVTVVVDKTAAAVPNPGVLPQSVTVDGRSARYVRFTATELAERRNDYIFALAELRVLTPEGVNAAAGATVTALDSIEAPPRWRKANLIDGIDRGTGRPEALAEVGRLQAQREALLKRAMDEPLRRRQARLDEALQKTTAALQALPPRAMVYAAATEFKPQGHFVPTHGEPRPIHVLARGNEQNPLAEVGPGTVGCLRGLPSRFDLGASHDPAARRAALAGWIVDPRNPLTWRSIVNRIWYYHFGRGIVETLNDFGRMGARPTHPELLDWLAVEFRDRGQSIKALHRLILNSATYRQCSSNAESGVRNAELKESALNTNSASGTPHSALRTPHSIDSGNRFLWRMNRSRLEAEAIRDAVLAVSGKLRPEMGGPGFRAFGFEDDHSPRYKYHEHDPDDPASQRRSVYRFIVRSVPDPFLTTLDCADPSLIVARRTETLTALQALAMLNNKFMVRMAEHFAARVEAMGGDTPARITAAYRLALQRDPSANELQVLVPLAKQHGLANVCRLILNTNEFVFVD